MPGISRGGQVYTTTCQKNKVHDREHITLHYNQGRYDKKERQRCYRQHSTG